jgi:hypothetical protein
MSVELLQVVKALTVVLVQQVQTFLQAVAVAQPPRVVVQQAQQVKVEAVAQVHLLIHLGVLSLALVKMYLELIGSQAVVVVVEILTLQLLELVAMAAVEQAAQILPTVQRVVQTQAVAVVGLD